MSGARTRFLREIAGHLDVDRVVEVHLFQPLRHGGKESGVAVIAIEPSLNASGGEHHATADGPGSSHSDTNVREGAPAVDTGPGAGPAYADPHAPRLTIYRAQYRHTLKGPDRGRWELELVAEADAPLPAVDDVVRGVHRRAGEDVEPERLTGEAFRAALVEEPWSASAR